MAALTLTLLKFIPVFIILFIIKKLYGLYQRRKELQRALKDFPGPTPHWLWGNMKELTGDYQGMLRTVEYAKKYNGAFPVWMGPTDAFLMTVHPSTVKYVLSGTDPKDEFSYALMRPWIGDGLLLSGGKKWDRNRRLMTPAFHQDILKHYVKTFYDSSKILIEKWRETTEPVETFHHISLLTLDSMMKCLFDYNSDCQNERTRHPYIQGVYDVSELIVKRITNPFHHNPFIYKFTENGKKFYKACEVIHEHSSKIISDRKQLLQTEKKGSRNTDFLDILINSRDEDGNGMSDTEIQDEVDTFMFEGHDSTASTLSWCLYNLAKHPEYQERCREEIKEKWGNKDEITWEDINKLEYTLMCVKESMRMFAPVPNISRCTEKDILLPDGRLIPAGVRMGVSIYALQRNPDVWKDPEIYDPSRFSSENKVSALQFMAFSMGPRNCIGMQFALTQIKVIIPMIIRNFHLDLDPERPAEPESMLILRSKNGLYLKVTPI
ncbi:CYP4B1 [Mytilus coruscus]|uniref:CYP4B1 n=1 Tax=Mytilus coruscus TaxID=42192 RepID=A0A6J8C5I2_MYTCO|nr:CYP4B1 [Mytilus coruscus]